ncbi:MAG: matrixin family metalloprotease [Phycisphaeraceae bacterium]|nr:matrixin family metalloprotease [Phycisphaeraceae bacterium]
MLTMCIASTGSAFTLYNFPTPNDVLQNGLIPQWNRGSPQFMTDISALPRVMSVKIDDNFLPGLAPAARAEAINAVWSAFDSWSQSTSGMITFQESAWSAVRNLGAGPLADWEGPSLEEWQSGQFPGTVPGWGAQIEIFSIPQGEQFTMQGRQFQMTSNLLGFNVTARSGVFFDSIDIYLNQNKNWHTDGLGGFDVETVVLHELGHALGLDHPNETIDGGCAAAVHSPVVYQCTQDQPLAGDRGANNGCHDSPNLDPYFWTPGLPSSPADVMEGAYTGLKRQLTDDEVGGMAFIYRPFAGDVTGNFNCTLLDVATAVEYTNGHTALDPRALAAADFMNHNGIIDAIELSYMLDWAQDPNSYDQGSIPQFDPPKLTPSSMTVTATADPYDVGKGGQLEVALAIDNPDAIPVLSWTLNIRYDENAFLNAGCIDGNFPPFGFKIMSELEPGLIQIGKISATASALTAGDLGTLTFDIDIPQAVAMASGAFVIEYIEVVVNDGAIRVYGMMPDDNVFLSDAQVIASDLDVNLDSVVNLDDLYQWHLTPIDVNQSGATDDADRESLSDCLRAGELNDLLTENN